MILRIENRATSPELEMNVRSVKSSRRWRAPDS
jgi:hypothetical protein